MASEKFLVYYFCLIFLLSSLIGPAFFFPIPPINFCTLNYIMLLSPYSLYGGQKVIWQIKKQLAVVLMKKASVERLFIRIFFALAVIF